MKQNKSEKGQIVVLLSIMLVVLVAFASLAINVGRVYSERSRAQAAADASALRAALTGGDDCEGTWESDGKAEALNNGFTNDGTTNTVTINCPYAGKRNYYQAIITTTIDGIFLQNLIFGGDLTNTVEAVARVDMISDRDLIVATDPDECPGILLNGNSLMVVTDGDIFSNSNCSSSLDMTNNATVTVAGTTGGEINLAGDWNGNGTISPAGALNEGVTQRVFIDPPAPDCSGLPTDPFMEGGFSQPGIYTNSFPSSPLAPGLYCLDVSTGNNDHITGTGVLLYFREDGSSLDLSGNNAELDVTASTTGNWAGMVIYMDPANTSGFIDVNGNGSIFTTGTIWANHQECRLTGNGNTFNSAFFCGSIRLNGGAELSVMYDDNHYNFTQKTITLVQ